MEVLHQKFWKCYIVALLKHVYGYIFIHYDNVITGYLLKTFRRHYNVILHANVFAALIVAITETFKWVYFYSL